LALLGKTEPDDDPIPLVDVLDRMGISAALWCTHTLPEHDCEWRLFAVWCARQNLDLLVYEAHREALEVVEAYALGQVGPDDLGEASRGVWGSMPGSVNRQIWQAAAAVGFTTSPNAAFAARCASGWSALARPENRQYQINHLRGILTL
jgi:hypothetical protein